MRHKQGFYEKYIKRPQDFCCAFLALIVLSPVLLVTAMLVRVKLGSPIIFKQDRPGLNGKIFKLYKFRTMTDKRDEKGNLLPDEKRLTGFGHVLSLHFVRRNPGIGKYFERGYVSMRPPDLFWFSYLSRYSPEQHRRHEVRPGLTGYAQVYGRNLLTWEEKFEKDVYYVDNISMWLDIKIIFKTIAVVLRREGISSETSATMEEFKGNENKEQINA